MYVLYVNASYLSRPSTSDANTQLLTFRRQKAGPLGARVRVVPLYELGRRRVERVVAVAGLHQLILHAHVLAALQ